MVCFREKGGGVCLADAGVAILQSYAFLLVRFGESALLIWQKVREALAEAAAESWSEGWQ